ncbi:DUF2345 domain-containing protein, partial [Oryzomicrobium sp.]|uniref:DUF2345 domain-containing protein n=1 Tax=Oryzomicrobium sp. TaxID=1911578 RepID=UPI002FE0C572
RSISLFVQGVKDKTAIKLYAAQGKIDVQAQSASVDLVAQQELAFTAATQDITASAGKELIATSGGGYFKLAGGNANFHCPGTLSIKCAKLDLSGGTSITPLMPQLPGAAKRYDEQFQALDLTGSRGIANLPYRVTLSDGRVISGITDEEGRTQRIYGGSPLPVEITWGGLVEGLIEEDQDHSSIDECC